MLHKGYTLLERLVTGWNQEAGGAALPVDRANIRALVPPSVARRFAVEQLFGRTPTQEELDAIKKPPTAPTPGGEGTAPSA